MLKDLFPRVHPRYSTLPVLGLILADYARWLFAAGYPRHRVLMHLRSSVRLDALLGVRGLASLDALDSAGLMACRPADSQVDCELTALVRALHAYFLAIGRFSLPVASRVEAKVAEYRLHMERVRGLSGSTMAFHARTVTDFLNSVAHESQPNRLAQLKPSEIEAFIRATGTRISRASLQHVVSHLRGFLRFLTARGETQPGLDALIDTPRLYRGEHLPRALPWDTVRALLRAVDRDTGMGRRDYAIFLLVATYGLRPSDIVALKLEDIGWRAGTIQICQRKTGVPLLLPLTDEVGSALVAHLRGGRPAQGYREVFLRDRAPVGVLKPTAVGEAFQALCRNSGLIPSQGVHCLRHSFAVHLLREGTALRTIGELLGHRTAEATCVYLRLAVDDLRDVSIPLPVASSRLAVDGQQ